MAEVRLYRLSPPDRTGWLLGLTLSQLAVLVAGGIVSSTVMVAVSVPAGALLGVIATVFGVVRVQGTPAVELVPHAWRTVVHRDRTWEAPVIGLGGGPDRAPTALADQEVLLVDTGTGGGPRVVVRHRRSGLLAATLVVRGGQFALQDRTEQDVALARWGSALQGFITERRHVRQIAWTETAVPASFDDHHRWLTANRATDPIPASVDAYDELLAGAGPAATAHEVHVTVTVDPGRLRNPQAGIDTLLTEVGLFADRLAGAGLTASGPLTPPGWAQLIRTRLDPHAIGDARRALSVEQAGPVSAEAGLRWWRTDGSYHRALLITDWPRIDVPANWLAPVLDHATTRRTLTIIFEPIPRSRSTRAITRDAAKLAADTTHRRERGFRVGAAHRRVEQAIDEREAELVAGYGECAYAGILTVAAATPDQLDVDCDTVAQVCAAAGIEARPLTGRHDTATVATLPVAAALAPRLAT